MSKITTTTAQTDILLRKISYSPNGSPGHVVIFLSKHVVGFKNKYSKKHTKIIKRIRIKK